LPHAQRPPRQRLSPCRKTGSCPDSTVGISRSGRHLVRKSSTDEMGRLLREPYVHNSRKITRRGCLVHKMMGAFADR
jgi:hypothetical protein